jgi:hypothetical protein
MFMSHYILTSMYVNNVQLSTGESRTINQKPHMKWYIDNALTFTDGPYTMFSISMSVVNLTPCGPWTHLKWSANEEIQI